MVIVTHEGHAVHSRKRLVASTTRSPLRTERARSWAVLRQQDQSSRCCERHARCSAQGREQKKIGAVQACTRMPRTVMTPFPGSRRHSTPVSPAEPGRQLFSKHTCGSEHALLGQPSPE
jgi:hypothetical protein